MTQAPSPFSTTLPNLQIAWDATSLRALMTCARYYQLSILEGWRPQEENAHLEFGRFYASAAERYKKARLSGHDKVSAMVSTLRWLMEATWTPGGNSGHCPCPERCNGCEYPDGKPWGGRYEALWHCTGITPYHNHKGHRAKCPYSHAGVWMPGTPPDVCSCGSPIEVKRQWIPDHPTKDRYGLVSLVIGYMDQQPEDFKDGPAPYVFPDGQPAVELSFKMPLPWKAGGRSLGEQSEQYILCGHMDSIMVYGDEAFISDNKTTVKALNAAYFAAYAPNIQMDVYDLAGSTLFQDLAIRGIMIEAAQTLKEGNHFGIGISYRSDATREELLKDLHYWLGQAEGYAKEGYWPMNRASCTMCPFKVICKMDPESRPRYLEASFVKHPWNPLEER